MPKTLKEIIDTASQTFPDHFLQKEFKNETPSDTESLSVTETLAAYLIKEFEELYDPGSSDHANLRRIISSLERSVSILEGVVKRLRSLDVKS